MHTGSFEPLSPLFIFMMMSIRLNLLAIKIYPFPSGNFRNYPY
jgi:hypothetical protein